MVTATDARYRIADAMANDKPADDAPISGLQALE
jgi:hypothetical protein